MIFFILLYFFLSFGGIQIWNLAIIQDFKEIIYLHLFTFFFFSMLSFLFEYTACACFSALLRVGEHKEKKKQDICIYLLFPCNILRVPIWLVGCGPVHLVVTPKGMLFLKIVIENSF